MTITSPSALSVVSDRGRELRIEIPARTPRRGPHLPALDGVRGLAVLAVMLFHLAAALDPQRLGHSMLLRVASVGWCGVDLFFVLSGFLITGILWDSRNSPHYFQRFYVRRMLRIFPVYYGVLLVIFGLVPWFRPASPRAAWIEAHQGWFWLYGTNLLIALRNPYLATPWYEVTHFWSLAVEEHFYFVWPAVVLAFSRRGLMRISVGLIFASMLLRIWLYPHLGGRGVYVLTPCRMDGLACGALLALALRGGTNPRRLLRWTRPMLFGCALGLFLIARWRGHLDAHDPIVQLLGYPLSALASLSLVTEAAAASRRQLTGKILGSRVLCFLGRYSYGLYVYHVLLRPTFQALLAHIDAHCRSYPLACCLYVLLSASLSILIACVSYHTLERPFLRLKERFSYS